jgi:cobalt-zinc-cadmium efflux system membrane fusion protein
MKNILYNNSNYWSLTLLMAFFFTLVSCNTTEQEIPTHENDRHDVSSVVELSPAQFNMAGVELVQAVAQLMSKGLKVSGVMDTPPQQLISVSAPLGGFLKNTDLLQGMKVKKGQVLAVLEHPNYVELQQNYLDKKTQLEFLEFEFNRQERLNKENVNSQKVFQQAKSDFMSMKIQVKGLEEKLAIIGVNASNLSVEKISREIKIYSPISGYVSEVNTNIGRYVNPVDVLFEIVNTDHLHAELIVYEQDIHKLKIGQKVRFYLPSSKKEIMASVYLIGRKIDADRSVMVHAHLDKEDVSLLPGMYINAVIELDENEVNSLPEEAVVFSEGKNYVFVLKIEKQSTEEKNYVFEMKEVTKGLTENGYTAFTLLNKDVSNIATMQFAGKGAFSVLAKMKNTEEEGH